MCGGVIGDIIDVIEDVVEVIVDLVEDVIGWLVPTPDIPDFGDLDQDQQAKGVLVNKISANSSIPIVYGTRKVGGNIVFLESSGATNEFLFMAIVLSEGEIDDITKIFINDNEVTFSGDLADNTERTVASSDANFFKAPDADSSAESLITVRPHFGSDTQTQCSLLGSLSSWTSNHKLQGLAYISLKFKWNPDAFGSIPNVTAIIKGKKIYNPNLDGSITGGSGSHRADTSSTWEYSDNPVYQLLDYMRNTRFGVGITNSYFDTNFADWQIAGDVCDANITPFSGASQIDLMDSHAVVDTSKKSIDNVKEFIKSCRGFLNFTGGLYKIIIETTGSASISITEDNIIGGITINSKTKNSRYNRVIASFVNPDKNFQSDEVQYPPADDSNEASADRHATMKALDGGILLEGRFNFGYITNPYQAREMAEIILRRSRTSLDVALKCDATALDLAIGDIVNITHATPAFSAKPFRVQGMTINSDMTVSLQLSEHQDSFYTFGTQQEVPSIPDTTLPNPFSVTAPTALTLTDEVVAYKDGNVLTRLNCSITVSADKFAEQYEVEIKQTLDKEGASVTDNFRVLGKGAGLEYSLINAIDGATYEVRARAISTLGVKSSFITATRLVIGQTAVPSDCENFSINVIGDQAILSWSAVEDLDLDFYQLRFSTDLSSPTWNNSFDLVDKIGRPATSITVPLKSGSYLLKAVDKLGNQSANETIVTTNIESINYVTQTTINEHSGFTGSKTGVTKISRAGVDYIGLTATGSVGTASTRVPASGIYAFANTIDLGAKLKGLFTASVSQLTEDVSEFFDGGRPSATTLFDDGRPNPFDGTAGANTHTILEISTSDDNTTYSAFKPFVVGEHIGRFFKFRVNFQSDNLKARTLISNLSVSVSLQKRRESGIDIASGSSSKAVTYASAFKVNPAIGISAQSLATGDFYTITNKSTTGFTIQFFNGSSNINRTFDFIAEGVGQVIA